MSVTCASFRSLIEGALIGRPDPGRLSALGFNEHLLSCASCRELLESEDAGLARTSHGALRDLTGKAFPLDPSRLEVSREPLQART